MYENDEPITDYIKYLTPGTYDVTLIVIGALGSQSDTNTRAGYVIVLPDTNTTTGCGTEVTDIDGNVYDVVEIGSQCWMKQNLKTATYNDGTPIPTGLDDVTWSDDSTDAYAVYDNNPVNADTFGYAYNWYAVNTGKLCPQGWHIPTQAEFETLIATIGGEAEGGALKLTDLWQAPNVGATNNSGFSAAGSGFRVNSGIYYGVGLEGHFWSSTESLDGGAYNMFLRNDDSYVYLEGYPFENGFSCRCIKD